MPAVQYKAMVAELSREKWSPKDLTDKTSTDSCSYWLRQAAGYFVEACQ
jgi:hypothetical protein